MKNLKHLTNTDGHRLGRTISEPLPFPSDERTTWIQDPLNHGLLMTVGMFAFAVLLAIGRM